MSWSIVYNYLPYYALESKVCFIKHVSYSSVYISTCLAALMHNISCFTQNPKVPTPGNYLLIKICVHNRIHLSKII